MAQLTLFNVREEAPVAPSRSAADLDTLENYALLYTATAAGTHSGVRFMMTLDDAQRWCSSPESRGMVLNTEWAFFFTAVARFLNRAGVYGYLDDLDLRGAVDDGTWDGRIAAAGCTKIALNEIPAILRPLGVTVLTYGDTRSE